MSQTSDDDGTEIMSEDPDVVYTGNTCSEGEGLSGLSQGDQAQKVSSELNRLNVEEGQEESPFDPDETYVDVATLPKRNPPSAVEVNEGASLNQAAEDACTSEPLAPSQEIENSPPCSNGCAMAQQKQGNSWSEEPSQVTPSQDIEFSPLAKNDSSLELTFPSLEKSYSQESTEPIIPSQEQIENGKEEQTVTQRKVGTVKRLRGLSHDDVSSLSSISQSASSSSSSKRPTESDDTDDFMTGSQDLFETQGSSLASQNTATSVSQFLPTLQLSGDIPSSQGYDGFHPKPLDPSSPTAGSTSTPLRHKDKAIARVNQEIISISDEEDSLNINEKRKLSDSSDGGKPEMKKAKTHTDSRQSVMILNDFRSSIRKPSTPDSEDPSLNSQAFNLHYSSDVDLNESQEMEVNSLAPSKNVEHDTSIVHLDDEEIECVSSSKVNSSEPEVILDSSGPPQNKSDIVVVPSLTCEDKKMPVFKYTHNTKDFSSPLPKHSEILSPLLNKPFHTSLKQQSPSEVLSLDNSKENIHPEKQVTNIHEFEGDLVFSFTCTYKVSCKTAVNMDKKEAVTNTISSFQVLESKTVPKRDPSPSTLEESGGGSPGSVASGPGPFTLQPTHTSRFSLMSTTSSSSAGSSVSNYYRPTPTIRGRAAVPLHKKKELPVKSQGPLPWKVLLAQCQTELADSGAEHLEKWSATCVNNLSSDDGQTVHSGEKRLALDPLPEDDGNEEVLGIPSAALKKVQTSLPKGPVTEELESRCETPSSKRKRGRPPKPATPKTPKSSAKKKAPTPRKKNDLEVPIAADQSSMPEETSIGSDSCFFAPGSQVFGLWRGSYYPAKIESLTKPNHWSVLFHDGLKKVLSKNQIILVNTFEIGQEISVVGKKDVEYDLGKIISVTPLAKGEDLFTVKRHTSGEIVSVPISKLCISEKQAKSYFHDQLASSSISSSSVSSPTTRVSASKLSGSDREILRNLDVLPELSGKRTRTPKGSQTSVSRPGPSSTARRLIADNTESSTAEDEPLATALGSGALVFVQGVHPEKVGLGTSDPLARKGKGVKGSAGKKPLKEKEDESIIKQLGPLPPNGSKIFSGYSFMLTQTDVQPRCRPRPGVVYESTDEGTDADDQRNSSGSEHCSSDSENFVWTQFPMVKDRLARQISLGGGKVLKDWTEIVPKDIKTTYVVSDRPCLTPTFLHCVVRGVRGVSSDGIISCCKEGIPFSSNMQAFLLPPGHSYIRGEFVKWTEHKGACFLGDEIMVVGKSSIFKNFWGTLVKLAGAKLSKFSEGMQSTTIVVAEQSCSDIYLTRAKELSVPVVSPAWVTQSIIANFRYPPEMDDSFRYDYAETD